MNQLAVGIPTLVCYDKLDTCIKHLLEGTVVPTRVIVVDNGGAYSSSHPQVEVVKPNRNLGVAASWNIICKLAEPYDILLLNDDFVVAPGTVERMIGADGPFVTIDGSWSCILMRQGAWQVVGPYDERFYPAYFEDADYHYRLQLLGYDIIRLPADGESHATSSTLHSLRQRPDPRGTLIAFDACAQYYSGKWGGAPGHEQFRHPFGTTLEKDPLTVRYLEVLHTPSDIWEHLPLLSQYAQRCDHVTEFGCGNGTATTALLHANPKTLVGIDIYKSTNIHVLQSLARPDTEFTFLQQSTLGVKIDQTDFLFIDTQGTYAQAVSELALHHSSVNRWIAMHDTAIYGDVGEDGGAGLKKAISQLLSECPSWRVEYQVVSNNGLTVLGRH